MAAGGTRERAAVRVMLRAAPRFARPSAVARLEGVVEWRVTQEDGRAILATMLIADGRMSVRRGARAEPDLTLQLRGKDFVAVALGEANPVKLVFSGRLRVAGDLDLAMRLGRCFRR